MKTLAVAAMALSLAATGAAHAQGADPLEHYDAYFAAIDAGDYDLASEQGEAAWRAAESAWGEDGDTGLLAFTVAQFRVNTGDLDGAAEPARRALELANLSGEYSENEARLLVGITMVSSDPAGARQQLEAAIAGLESSGVPPRDDIIRGELDLAMLQGASDPGSAVELAEKAVEQSRGIDSANLRSHLAQLGKVQYVAGEFGKASMTLAESLNMWDQQEIGVLPASLADTWAWQAMAARASQLSGSDEAPEGASGGPGRGFGGGFGGGAPRWSFMADRSMCAIDYEDFEPVPFPEPEGDTVTVGANVVMFDLGEDGKPTNIRTLASAPGVPHYEDFIAEQIGRRELRRFVREPCRPGQVEVFAYDF